MKLCFKRIFKKYRINFQKQHAGVLMEKEEAVKLATRAVLDADLRSLNPTHSLTLTN